MIDREGRVWFNGHFTKEPIRMGYVDAASGETKIIDVSVNSSYEDGSPIPYGLRVAADGTVWSIELTGNRLIKYTPESGDFETYMLPISHSGPRRLDISLDGSVWVPEFANGKPATQVALVRHLDIDEETGDVWAAYSHSPGLHPKVARLRVE